MDENKDKTISWADFIKLEMRVGTILTAENFQDARNPAYKMMIDFGDYGIRKTSAQITQLYSTEELVGKQVIAVLNFPPKQIANMMSECLVLGGVEGKGVTLIKPDQKVENGTRVG
ncbi:MAG TPA: tRNA-binding protein [Brumimicrobium sp.]|nr:tRNA-binding protein [Brumimicrobium sp.]